ncbi:MAG: GvpL/GvpF family gas vesicle protein [Candidatus Yanofskybacteria bacterium]|nr:GvpL/GvpF family gas vesicle protein [Candidatus Yanofskybacteria bacterium]
MRINQTGMSEEKKYIYSILRKSQDGPAPDSVGINDRSVVFISHGDIAAAVSNTHLINFDKLDKKELTRLVAVHEQVNSNLMKQHDVIPMRFGMVAESIEEIRSILTKAYIQFKAALERIAGKAEFVVQVFWNEKNILEKLVQENAEIKKLKKKAESRGKILGFSSKMKLGKRIFEAVESCRKEYIEDILKNLAAYFPDFSAGPLHSRESEASKLLDTAEIGANGATKEMIMNYSFLIDKTEESALEFRLNQLAEKYSSRGGSSSGGKDALKFKYIGPMAPYSFAVINLSVGNFDLVDRARKTLGLGESAAFLEIKDAYHKLAAEHHPDKHEYKKDQIILEKAEKKMKDIITANEVLTVYCKHYLSALPPEKEQLCSFRKEDVEDSVIIKEK